VHAPPLGSLVIQINIIVFRMVITLQKPSADFVASFKLVPNDGLSWSDQIERLYNRLIHFRSRDLVGLARRSGAASGGFDDSFELPLLPSMVR
jgi:hypothetical protein